MDLIFGDDSLKVGILETFFGAKHQPRPGMPFDNETDTVSIPGVRGRSCQ